MIHVIQVCVAFDVPCKPDRGQERRMTEIFDRAVVSVDFAEVFGSPRPIRPLPGVAITRRRPAGNQRGRKWNGGRV